MTGQGRPPEKQGVDAAQHDAGGHGPEESADQSLLLGRDRSAHQAQEMEELVDRYVGQDAVRHQLGRQGHPYEPKESLREGERESCDEARERRPDGC